MRGPPSFQLRDIAEREMNKGTAERLRKRAPAFDDDDRMFLDSSEEKVNIRL